MKRIEFVRKVSLGAGYLALFGCAGACMNKASSTEPPLKSGKVYKDKKLVGFYIDLDNSKFSDLINPGAYAYFKKYIIIRTSTGELIALDKRCSHQGALLSYNAGSGLLKCPRHGSVFAESGEVNKGPAKENLKAYELKEEGKKVAISANS